MRPTTLASGASGCTWSYEDGEAGGHDRSVLLRQRRWLLTFLWAQIALGIVATIAVFVFSGGFMERPSQLEQIFATAHVAMGALLFVTSVATAMWSYRIVATGDEVMTGEVAEGVA